MNGIFRKRIKNEHNDNSLSDKWISEDSPKTLNQNTHRTLVDDQNTQNTMVVDGGIGECDTNQFQSDEEEELTKTISKSENDQRKVTLTKKELSCPTDPVIFSRD
jgi:hypothetical protein